MTQEHLDKELLKYVKAGNTKAAEALIFEGADIHQKNNYGETPLHWTAENGHTDTVALLKSWMEEHPDA